MSCRIWFSPYELEPRIGGSPFSGRRGVLVKAAFDDGAVGYADCHPWVECGDAPLDVQLEMLRQGRTTNLLHRTLATARVDADARGRGQSLFVGLRLPGSHWLAADVAGCGVGVSEGFTHIKIKGTDSLVKVIDGLPPHIKLRPDFNSAFSKETFKSWLEPHVRYLDRFDYFEDPFPYDPREWRSIQEEYDVALACDRRSTDAIGDPESAKVLIIKPAVQPVPEAVQGQRVVVTSYLDHPIGQAAAAYFAAATECQEICGLQSHRVYTNNPFSLQLATCGPAFVAPRGTGLGFDDLLAKTKWISL